MVCVLDGVAAYQQTPRCFTADKGSLMFLVPLDLLFPGCFGRHLDFGMPKPVQGTYRAIRNITQLSKMAEPTNSAKQ